jgi:hypothetical protein
MPADLRANLPAFLRFRIFFNCRFYYPVYAVFFLDLGLTIEQFALLNAAWAATIVLLEVPSGALADRIGRRPLVVAAGWLMVVEMLVLCFTPAHSAWTFPLFLLNRVLSGTAEALASGADEALAYDSLPADGRAGAWREWNARLIHWQSLGFMVASVAGALLYDPGIWNTVSGWIGSNLVVAKDFTLRVPVFLTLGGAFGAVAAALAMREPQPPGPPGPLADGLRMAWHETIAAAGWVWRTPAALALLAIGIFFDSLIRLFYTVASPFYRLIEIPDALFGFVGALAAATGIASARLGERLLKRDRPGAAFGVVAALTFAGCLGLAFPLPWLGLVFVAPFWLAMRLLHYFLSHYLNEVTPSARRATVLSFRGLGMNLGYGGLTLLYGAATAALDRRLPATAPGGDRALEVFAASARGWVPWFFGAGILLWVLLRRHGRDPLDVAIRRAAAAAGPPAP